MLRSRSRQMYKGPASRILPHLSAWCRRYGSVREGCRGGWVALPRSDEGGISRVVHVAGDGR